MNFKHEPLDAASRQVRLLKLQHANDDAEVTCTIDTYDLDSKPAYMALSYTWGSEHPKHTTSLNGHAFEIRDNLFNFLKHFRDMKENTQLLFIDQICIDQENVKERNHQVELMSRIYSGCTCVIAWLGCENGDVQAARSFLETGDIWNLKPLLSNVYFTRLWIVQEFLLAPQAWILCQQIWLPKYIMQALAERCSWADTPNGALSILAEGLQDIEEGHLWSSSLKTCLTRFGNSGCADKRDVIYGLLSLAKGTNIIVDYNKNVYEVYLDAVEEVVHGHRIHLDVFEGYDFLREDVVAFAEELARSMSITSDKPEDLNARFSEMWSGKMRSR